MEKIATGYRILASRIFFKAFTADYKDVPPELAQQNMARLDALAAKLEKFPDYKIRMVGHAVMINWDKPKAGQEEQKAILIPLSKARAEAVKAALIDRGLDAGRFATEGVGASDQLRPRQQLQGSLAEQACRPVLGQRVALHTPPCSLAVPAARRCGQIFRSEAEKV